MNILISMYDYTGLMVEKFREAGVHCLIIDAKHPEGVHQDPERPRLWKMGLFLERDFYTVSQIRKAVLNIAHREFSLPNVIGVFGFPPCDDLASSGARWFESKLKRDPDCQKRAAARAMLVEDVANFFFDVPWFAENPRGRLSTLWRSYDFTFDPFMYGGHLPENDVHPTYPEYIAARDAYPKETWIWCGNGFEKPPVRPVAVPDGYSAQYETLGGKSDKTKTIRSATPRGWAAAVFEMFQKKGWLIDPA